MGPHCGVNPPNCIRRSQSLGARGDAEVRPAVGYGWRPHGRGHHPKQRCRLRQCAGRRIHGTHDTALAPGSTHTRTDEKPRLAIDQGSEPGWADMILDTTQSVTELDEGNNTGMAVGPAASATVSRPPSLFGALCVVPGKVSLAWPSAGDRPGRNPLSKSSSPTKSTRPPSS